MYKYKRIIYWSNDDDAFIVEVISYQKEQI